VNLKKLLSQAASIFGVALVVGLIVWVAWQIISPHFDGLRNRDNREIVSFHEHYDLDAAVPILIFDGVRVTGEVMPAVHNGVPFIPMDFIRESIDPFIMWDASAQSLFVTTRNDMLAFRQGEVRTVDGGVLVPDHIVMGLYPFTVVHHEAYNVIVVTDDRVPQTTATVTGNAPLRFRPDVAAPMMVQLASGDTVTVLPANSGDGFSRVRTEEGLLGYVLTASFGETLTRPVEVTRRPLMGGQFIQNFIAPSHPSVAPINMVWEWIGSYEANAVSMEYYLPESITVISPTWFHFNAVTRELDSFASAEYVQWAHAQGVQVWPSVTDLFAGREGIRTILSSFSARLNIIYQLEEYVQRLNIDGLTIHIEHLMDAEYGVYYIQFLRELNIVLGHQVVLLVAMLPNLTANAHYRHDLVAKTVDFIALMTYNEYGGNAPTPGPVASLPWVERQIYEALRVVPANQLLMGLPFFNRVWRTGVADNLRRTPLDFDMERAYWEFYNRGVAFEWDEKIGAYYAEFAEVVDGETLRHQLWRECSRSLGEKMELFEFYNLAGIAGWNMSFTNEDVWELLDVHFPRFQRVLD